MLKKYLIKINDKVHEYGLFILIGLFIYIAIMLTSLNNSLETAKISINAVGRKIPYQPETVSITEMFDRVNFRHEFDNIQYRLEDIKDALDLVEINTRQQNKL